MIESKKSAHIKKIEKLKKNARFRRTEKEFVVEGFKMTAEALDHKKVKKLYVSETAKLSWDEKMPERFSLSALEKDGLCEVFYVVDKLFLEISQTVTPQGVMAIVAMPEYTLSDYINRESAYFVCLEDIQDPGNLGTIIRTAEGASMTGVLLSKGTVDLFNPKVVRSTMGALFRVPYFYADDLCDSLEKLKENDFSIYCTHLKAKKKYNEVDYAKKSCILVGNEANGVSEKAEALADELVIIPMGGKLESLNASVAAALMMYELQR